MERQCLSLSEQDQSLERLGEEISTGGVEVKTVLHTLLYISLNRLELLT